MFEVSDDKYPGIRMEVIIEDFNKGLIGPGSRWSSTSLVNSIYKELTAENAKLRAALEGARDLLFNVELSIEGDQIICDQDGSKLGAGWAFVEDVIAIKNGRAKITEALKETP